MDRFTEWQVAQGEPATTNVEGAEVVFPRVEYVGKFEPTDWEWAVVAHDGVCDRFETESDAIAALATGGYAP